MTNEVQNIPKQTSTLDKGLTSNIEIFQTQVYTYIFISVNPAIYMQTQTCTKGQSWS